MLVRATVGIPCVAFPKNGVYKKENIYNAKNQVTSKSRSSRKCTNSVRGET